MIEKNDREDAMDMAEEIAFAREGDVTIPLPEEPNYEFFPKDVRDTLPPLYAQENTPADEKKFYVKFFCPWSQWTWYALEGAPEHDDFRFFGYVLGLEDEWGYFMLSELEGVRGPGGLKIERDIHFTPRLVTDMLERIERGLR